MITIIEETRIISLRKANMFYGKEKLRAEYNSLYGEDVSSWKIGYTIQKYGLYPDLKKVEKHRLKIKRSRRKQKITELKKRNESILGHLVQIDTIVLHLDGLKRYILTAIDTYGKLAFARTYRNASSYSAADFLERLYFLFDNQIVNIQTDNGSEFAKHFEKACQTLKIDHYHSRARTPQDNAYIERFNQTLQKEWLNEGNFHPDTSVMNAKLTDWLIKYNFRRRHASLGNISPINYCIKNRQLLPMYSTRTLG
jgi:transposase InsO family protein